MSSCSKEHALQAIKESKDIIRKEPQNSVLALTDINNEIMYIPTVFLETEEFFKNNKPYVKASAILAAGEMRKLFVDTISKLSNRNFAVFEDMEKAKEWLAEV